jgi:hypothetical protein
MSQLSRTADAIIAATARRFAEKSAEAYLLTLG